MIAATVAIVAASTPEQAALHAVYAADHQRVTVVRIDRAGRFATVLLANALMEGAHENDPILVERFSFGWQAIDVVQEQCEFNARFPHEADRRALLAGMPHLKSTRTCDPPFVTDSGPAHDIDVLRAESFEPLIPSVVISGQFALLVWYGAGGGETIYRKTAGHWRRVTGGGGAFSVSELASFGVPKRDGCRLIPDSQECAHSR